MQPMQIIQTQIALKNLDKPVSWILNKFSASASKLTKEKVCYHGISSGEQTWVLHPQIRNYY